MKILFKNITKYTKENTNNFVEFHSNKYGKKELIRTALLLIGIIYIVVCNLISKNWLLILIIALLGVLVYLISMLKLKKKEKEKKKNKNKIKEYTFYFYEKYIKIRYKRNYERLKYFELYKVFETDKYFFLYLDENKSLILAKDGFEIGTPRNFSKFIKNKCPFKYRNEEK